jgi:hypothetical protein
MTNDPLSLQRTCYCILFWFTRSSEYSDMHTGTITRRGAYLSQPKISFFNRKKVIILCQIPGPLVLY